MLQFGHIELFVADPPAALAFYRDVLGFEVTTVQHGGAVVWLKSGSVELLLRRGRGGTAGAYQDAESAIVLYCEDLDRVWAALRARGLQFRGTDGSDRCLTFTDPDGHWFQLVNPGEQ